MALVESGRVLLVRQTYRGQQIWTLPGGSIEPGETPAGAAVREAREEVGVDVRLTSLLYEGPRTSGNGSYYCYLGEVSDGQVALGHDPELPQDQQELRECRWVPLSDLHYHPEIARLLPALNAHEAR